MTLSYPTNALNTVCPNEMVVLILVLMWLTVYLNATMSFSRVESCVHADLSAQKAVKVVLLHSASVEALKQVPSISNVREKFIQLKLLLTC